MLDIFPYCAVDRPRLEARMAQHAQHALHHVVRNGTGHLFRREVGSVVQRQQEQATQARQRRGPLRVVQGRGRFAGRLRLDGGCRVYDAARCSGHSTLSAGKAQTALR
jgi:hypothetical protein